MREDDNFFWDTIEEFMSDSPIACMLLIFCAAILLALFGLLLILYPVLIPFFVAVVILAVSIWKFLKWGIKRHNR